MPPGWIIRRLGPEDLTDWRSLRLEGLEQSPEAFLTTLDEERATPDTEVKAMLARRHILGLWIDGVLSGTVALDPETHPRTAHRVWLNAVHVAALQRGKGAGRALMEAALSAARAEGRLQAELFHAEDNHAAARLYTALGFQTVGRFPRAVRFGDGFQDDLHLVRVLDEAP